MKILVFRALKIGDMLCSMPALVNLRKHYPEAKIDIITLPNMMKFMARFSAFFDELIPFSGYPNLPERKFSLPEYDEMLDRIHAEKYDLFIQMHGDGTHLESFISDMGIPKVWSYCLGMHGDRFLYPHHLHEIRRHNALLEYYDVPIMTEEIPFPCFDVDVENYERMKEYFGFREGKYIVLHPGASCADRRWEISNFAEIATLLDAKGYKILVSGVDSEQALFDNLQGLLSFRLEKTVGKIGLGPLALFLRNSAGLISNCTGVSHIAAATQTRSVIFSKDGEPARWSPLNTRLHKTFDCQKNDQLEEVIEYVQTSF